MSQAGNGDSPRWGISSRFILSRRGATSSVLSLHDSTITFGHRSRASFYSWVDSTYIETRMGMFFYIKENNDTWQEKQYLERSIKKKHIPCLSCYKRILCFWGSELRPSIVASVQFAGPVPRAL